MSGYIKLLSIFSIIVLSSCAKTGELKPTEVEQEFAEQQTQETKSYELLELKNPEKFVRYYLRSKISLYNSNSLDSIAQNNYKLALENPNSFETQEQAFLLLLANKNYAKAINVLNNKNTQESITFEDLFKFAQAMAQNEEDQAHQILKNIINNENRLPYLKIVNAYFNYNNHKKIETLESDILGIKSSVGLNGFKYYYIARAYEQKQDFHKAFEYYYTAFSKHTLRTEDVFSRMVYTANKIDPGKIKGLFKSSGKYGKNIYLVDQAFVDISKLKALDNSLKQVAAQAFFDIGWSVNQTTANLAGLDFLALADYIAPNDKIKFQMAKGYFANGWEENSINVLSSINSKSDYYLSAKIVLADVLKKEQPEKAINVIKQLKATKRFNQYYLDSILGQFYLNTNQYKKAIVSFTKALNIDKSSKIYFSRGVAYEKTNQIDKAFKDLETALEKNPKNPIVLNYLGYLLIDLNKEPKKGLKYIEQAVKLDPASSASLDSFGWAYIKLKEYKKGLSLLESAYSIDQQDGVITGHLGDAYMYNNRPKEAIIYWKKALELETDDIREVNRIKQQLYKYNK